MVSICHDSKIAALNPSMGKAMLHHIAFHKRAIKLKKLHVSVLNEAKEGNKE